MKLLLGILSVLLMFTFLINHEAKASGDLVGGAYYLDDYGQAQVSPKLGLKVHSDIMGMMPKNLEVISYLGGGYIAQQADMNGNTPSGFYGDWQEGLHYKMSDTLYVEGAGGIAFNKSVYKSFDDYIHVVVGYKLW